MSKFQKQVKKKIIEKKTIQKNQNIRNSEVKSTKSNRNLFAVFTISCILIGAGVIIALNVDNINDNNSSQEPKDDSATPENDYVLTQSVTTIHDEQYQLSSFEGKLLILYFTGASCIPCKMQLPFIVNAYDEYKATEKVEVISLDIQGIAVAELIQWESENGITWKVCQDTNMELSSYFSVFSMPTLVICDMNGNEINRYVGAQTEETINQIFLESLNY